MTSPIEQARALEALLQEAAQRFEQLIEDITQEANSILQDGDVDTPTDAGTIYKPVNGDIFGDNTFGNGFERVLAGAIRRGGRGGSGQSVWRGVVNDAGRIVGNELAGAVLRDGGVSLGDVFRLPSALS